MSLDLEAEVQTLVPLGAIDMNRMVMPDFKNLVTEETGALDKLSQTPGAMWQATWILGEPWYVRLDDGQAVEVRPEELP